MSKSKKPENLIVRIGYPGLLTADVYAKPYSMPKYRVKPRVVLKSSYYVVGTVVPNAPRTVPDTATRIAALKGAFAMAAAAYDDATEADIKAAVAAGYGDPEVLKAIAPRPGWSTRSIAMRPRPKVSRRATSR